MARTLVIVGVILIAVVVVGIAVYYFLASGGLSKVRGVVEEKVRGNVKLTSIELYVDADKVSEAETPIEAHIGLYNSFPVEVELAGGSLDVYMDDLKVAKASIPSQKISKGSNTLIVNIVLDNTLMDEVWYRHLRNNEKSSLVVKGDIAFKTPIGDIKIPVSFTRNISTSIFPVEKEVNREVDLGLGGKVIVRKIRVELAGVTPSQTKLRAYVTVENKLKFIPLYVNGVVFSVKLSDGTIIAEGRQKQPVSIAPGEVDDVPFDIVLDNSKIPVAWYKHVKNHEETKVIVEVWLEVKVRGKTIELFKDNPLTIETTVKTSLFKYK